MSEQPGRYQRSFPGMIGAMIVLVLVVGAFVVFREVTRDEPANPAEPVDFTRDAEYARSEADFDLLAPEKLPDGWIATSVRFSRERKQAWHLGMLTDEGRYVGLEQAEQPIEVMVEKLVDKEATQGDDVTVDGQRWQTWTDEDGDLALVRGADGVSTLVVGRVPLETIEELLTTLR